MSQPQCEAGGKNEVPYPNLLLKQGGKLRARGLAMEWSALSTGPPSGGITLSPRWGEGTDKSSLNPFYWCRKASYLPAVSYFVEIFASP